MSTPCPFCQIIRGHEHKPDKFFWVTSDVCLFEPLNPVAKGHLLFVPRVHVEDAAHQPDITGRVMEVAAESARIRSATPFNLITSSGEAASQSVFHLHVHYVPRAHADGLALPWTQPDGD